MQRIVFAAILILTAGAIARAEFKQGSQTVSIMGGLGGSSSEYDYQPGTSESVAGTGGAFGGQYLYYFSDKPAMAIGVDLARSMNGTAEHDDALQGFDSEGRLKSFVAMLVGRLSYPRGVFRPYVLAGVGFHSTSQKLSARPRAGNTWNVGGGGGDRTLVDEDTTSAALGGGLGLDIFPTDNFFLGLEFRGVWLAGMSTDDTPQLQAEGFNVHEENGIVQGNILFRAGVKF